MATADADEEDEEEDDEEDDEDDDEEAGAEDEPAVDERRGDSAVSAVIGGRMTPVTSATVAHSAAAH